MITHPTMQQEINEVVQFLSARRFDLTREKMTQLQIQQQLILHCHGPNPLIWTPEYSLDKKNRPDFFEVQHGIALEVKIKGAKMAIYKQCERYCKFEAVKALILCTNKAMGFPAEINGKPCYFINLGKAWL